MIITHFTEKLAPEESQNYLLNVSSATRHTGIANVPIQEILDYLKSKNKNFILYFCPTLDRMVADHLNTNVYSLPDHDASVLFNSIFPKLNLPVPKSINAEEPYKEYFTKHNLLNIDNLSFHELDRIKLLHHLKELGVTTITFEYLFWSI